MSELQMLTQEQVAELFGTTRDNIAMLREIGVIKHIKIGKCYMFSQDAIRRFQHDYEGYDVSNRVRAIDAYNSVEMKKANLAESA